MKHLVWLLPLFLCACAPQATKVDMPGTDGSISVPVKDLRPASEKVNETFSLMITSSGYGIYREGDATLDPPMTQIFRRRAWEKLGTEGTKDITLHHMVVYLNAKSQLRKGAIGGGLGGIVGAMIAAGASANVGVNMAQSLADRKQFESVADEYERAFYSEAENPQKASVFVIYIDAEINGRRLFVRTLAPIKGAEGTNPYGLAAESAVQYYLVQYQALTPAVPPAPVAPAPVPPAEPGTPPTAAPVPEATPAPPAPAEPTH